MSEENKPYPGTQAVLRAISLLKVFSDEQPEWGLSELAAEVGLNKTTTYRLLTALGSEGLVARNPDGDSYTLGPEIVVLGGRALRTNTLRTTTQRELEALAAATGETVTLEILSENKMLIIDEVIGDRLMSSGPSIGTRWPLHGTSTGLAILAYLPPSRRDKLLSRSLRRYTPKTLADHGALLEALPLFRQQGYAVADEALELGFVAIGAPLLNYDNDVVAAISVGGPTVRLTADRIPEVGELVRKTAARISARLGHSSG